MKEKNYDELENNDIKINKENKDDNFLLYIPSKRLTTFEVNKGKVLLIFHHNKPIEKFVRWMVKKPYTSDMQLDDLGSLVWLSINGESTVYEIGEILKEKFGKGCEPVYDRLIMFIRYLHKRGWITLDRGDQNKNRGDNYGNQQED